MAEENSAARDELGAPQGILIGSLVSYRTGEPLIHIECPEQGFKAVLTPEGSMEHAISLMEVTIGALCDGYLTQFAKDRLRLDERKIGMLLREFREYRNGRLERHESIVTDVSPEPLSVPDDESDLVNVGGTGVDPIL